MSTVTPVQVSFNGGELSRRAEARIDQAVREISVRRMHGWLPTLQGPAETCPGFLHVAQAADPAAILVPFGFSVTQHYVLEISDGAIRFYTNEARIETAPGVAYSIAAPWTQDQLAAISWEQSGDVLYLYHPDVQTQKLSRLTATTFTLTPVVFAGGPFDPRNSDETVTVTASNVWGNVVLTASAAIFDAGDVGRLFRIEAGDLGTIGRWEPGISVTAGQLIQSPSVGLVYQALGAGRTGTVEPTHSEGAEYDGMASGTDINGAAAGGVQWLYLHDRYGLLRITAFTSATEVEAEVIRRLPFMVSAGENYTGGIGGGGYNPWEPTEFDPDTFTYTPPSTATYTPASWRWQFGSFSDRSGWPRCGAIWQERHIVAADNIIHGSVVGDFENFAPLNEFGDISRDQAFQLVLNQPDAVQWLCADEQLLAGTERREWAIGPASLSEAAGPGNLAAAVQGSIGAAAGKPVHLDGRVLFVQRGHRRVVEFAYQIERNRFETPDLNRFANHIGTAGLTTIAMQQEPVPLLWAVRRDGTLACAIYEPREQALGWATRTLGGGMLATSACVIRDSNGEFDQYWIMATSADGSVGHVMRLARVRLEGEDARRDVMLDMAHIVEGDGLTEITAPALAGETGVAVIDGIPHNISFDGSGIATLPVPGDEVIAGLPYPAELELLTLEAGGDNGPALMKMGRIGRMGFMLLQARGLDIEVQGLAMPLATQATQHAADSEPPAADGIYWVQTVGTHSRARPVIIRRSQPYPATLLAIMAEIAVQQAGGRDVR